MIWIMARVVMLAVLFISVAAIFTASPAFRTDESVLLYAVAMIGIMIGLWT